MTSPGARLAFAGLAARLILGAVLVFSGATKASAPAEEFAVIIESFGLVGADAAQSLALLLPWCELLVGFALIFGYGTSMASATAAAMMLAFIFALLSTKARGIAIPNCGCFGGRVHVPPMVTAAIDVVLLGLAALSYLYGRLRLSLDKWSDQGYT